MAKDPRDTSSMPHQIIAQFRALASNIRFRVRGGPNIPRRPPRFHRFSSTVCFAMTNPLHSLPNPRRASSRRIVTLTEQIIPRRECAVFGKNMHNVHKETSDNLDAKIYLLSPLPGDCPPLAKSVLFLSSNGGSVQAEIARIPGAENHFFRLFIISTESKVTIVLPKVFCGIVNIERYSGERITPAKRSKVRCSAALHERITKGYIRINDVVTVDHEEDEVYIQAPGRIELKLAETDNVLQRHRIRRN